jgi:dihydrofolate synthase/folylpolyglutamate synthase
MGRYQDVLDFIFGYVNYERAPRYAHNALTLNLDRMHALLARLGNPQNRFQSVHIAGTKGKGSTSALVESVLRTAGYRTGLYTSPHLHTFRERIRVAGALIPKQDLADLLARCRPAIEATTDVIAFEIITALAFVYFAQREVEWAVLEVGLGGRLDATNVVKPAVCGITSLSYDHVERLGHNLTQIAWEKAGIIKPGAPVVSEPQEPDAMAILRQAAAETGARLVTVGVDWTYDVDSFDREAQTFSVRRTADAHVLPDLHIPLLGRHQLANAATAIAMLAELSAQGLAIGDEALREGLAATRWPGRFETLARRPALVVDGAHNADSAHKLRTALRDWFPPRSGRRLALIFGSSGDKDITGMLAAFLNNATDRIILTRSGHPRSADPHRLAEQAHQINPTVPVGVCRTLDDALDEAVAWAGPDDVICVTGSLFVVAQARRAWAKRNPDAFAPNDWVWQDETPGEAVADG